MKPIRHLLRAILAPTEQAATTRWRALPGNHIELADTGFQITYTHEQPGPFVLYTPEHSRAGWGGDLQALKRWAEQLAADRAEFTNPRADIASLLRRRTH